MKVGLMGSKGIGRGALDIIRERDPNAPVVTIDDGDDPRSELSYFRQASARVVATRSEANEAVREMDADLVIVAAWYWIIPLSERPFVGIHHSLLPKYRGGSPLVWALINGEPAVGTSLFTLTDEVDAGPLWAQVRVPSRDGYIGDVMARCDEAALDSLRKVLASQTEPRPQDGPPTWCSPRSRSDGIIDWSRPAIEIQRWIRAQSHPYPGAFTYSGPDKVTIWRATATEATHIGTAGQVEGNTVICGDRRLLRVEEADRMLASTLASEPL
jgi:methionyl-tRNA formyltransferase